MNEKHPPRNRLFLPFLLCFTMQMKAAILDVLSSRTPENEPFLEVAFARDGDTNLLQRATFWTIDGTARAGIDYIATTGTVTFLPGQFTARGRVALINNGLVDGERRFRIEAASMDNLARRHFRTFDESFCPDDYGLGIILDDEFPLSQLDPLFAPRVWPNFEFGSTKPFMAEFPDNRIAVAGGAQGTVVLRRDGTEDPAFSVDPRFTFFQPLHVFPDGRILGSGLAASGEWVPPAYLSADGTVLRTLPPSILEHFGQIYAVQPDEKLLVFTWNQQFTEAVLHRLNADGTRDPSFTEPHIYGKSCGPTCSTLTIQPEGLGLQPNGAIILVGRFTRVNDTARTSIVRFFPDGRIDEGFAPVLARHDGLSPEVLRVLPRRTGQILISGWFETINGIERCCFAQLTSDGTLDPSFNPPEALAGWTSHFGGQGLPVEERDGKLIVVPDESILDTYYANSFSPVRLNQDGSIDSDLKVRGERVWCYFSTGSYLSLTSSNDILFGGYFKNIDGFTRNYFALIRSEPPVPEFRVLTPADAYVNGGVARLKVVRTGPTTKAASVAFATRDRMAKAGLDYVTAAGVLEFAPTEAAKEIVVRTLNPPALPLASPSFVLELTDPRAGYAAVPSTPVYLLPGFYVKLLAYENGGFARISVGPVRPGALCSLERSADLLRWDLVSTVTAQESSLTFDDLPISEGASFYRARLH